MSTRRIGLAEFGKRLRRAGVKGVAQRSVRALYRKLDVSSIGFTILPGDLADSTRLPEWIPASRRPAGGPSRIGFVCMAPGPGSGGHTTLFRMVKGLENRGYECTLYLYDPHGGELARREAVIREHWPWLSAHVRNVDDGFADVDAIVASSWETAHITASRSEGPLARLYFVQDYEPFFYPHGSLYAYAEDSYRMGLTTIALGNMVASLVRDHGIAAEMAPFGCDTETYSLQNRGRRSGIVFYAKPDNDRRGYLLGKAALRIFHNTHPEVDIHVYGDPVADWDIPVLRHSRLSPEQLNDLYNQSIGGLAFSFTNISLVAEEMLAAGAIPVINDSDLARADLSNTEAVWAMPTPGSLADALSRVVESADDQDRPVRASSQVREGWGLAQAVVARIVQEEIDRNRGEREGAPTNLDQATAVNAGEHVGRA
jgi:hypothetical protein